MKIVVLIAAVMVCTCFAFSPPIYGVAHVSANDTTIAQKQKMQIIIRQYNMRIRDVVSNPSSSKAIKDSLLKRNATERRAALERVLNSAK